MIFDNYPEMAEGSVVRVTSGNWGDGITLLSPADDPRVWIELLEVGPAIMRKADSPVINSLRQEWEKDPKTVTELSAEELAEVISAVQAAVMVRVKS